MHCKCKQSGTCLALQFNLICSRWGLTRILAYLTCKHHSFSGNDWSASNQWYEFLTHSVPPFIPQHSLNNHIFNNKSLGECDMAAPGPLKRANGVLFCGQTNNEPDSHQHHIKPKTHYLLTSLFCNRRVFNWRCANCFTHYIMLSNWYALPMIFAQSLIYNL